MRIHYKPKINRQNRQRTWRISDLPALPLSKLNWAMRTTQEIWNRFILISLFQYEEKCLPYKRDWVMKSFVYHLQLISSSYFHRPSLLCSRTSCASCGDPVGNELRSSCWAHCTARTKQTLSGIGWVGEKIKMASLSRSKLHDDLQAAFVRHREGRYDPLLDSKKA